MTPRWPETLAPSGGPGAPGAPPAGSAARDAVSVAEAVRVHLPGGRLRGGAAGLTRRVTWATSLRSLPPAFEPRGGGELVLAAHSALESLRQVDGALTLVRVLDGLAGAGAAALVVAGPVPRDAARTADALGLPLVELPLGAPLLDAERGIIGFVLGRHSELQAQASDLYRRLAQLAVENRGLEAIVREAALATGRVAAFEDARFFLRTTAAPPGVTPPVLDGAGLSSADERGRLGEALRSQPVSTMAPVATLLPAARWGMVRYAAPVVTRERVRGFVSLCQPLAEGDLAEFDQLAASRTASLLAIELAKEDAVQAAEQRIQGDLVDELLHPFDAEGAGRRAAQAGLAAGGTFAVYALALEGSPDGHAGVNLVTSASAAAAATAAAAALADGVGRHLRRAGRVALVRVDGAELVVICQLTPAAGAAGTSGGNGAAGAGSEQDVQATGDELLGALRGLGFTAVAAGASHPHQPLTALPDAAREAREALRIGRRVYGPGRLVTYGDLGLYRVLHALHDSPELRTFYEQTLGPLVEYDRRTGQNWIETLEAFFACHGNLSQTALRLQLHRNALLYRIGRIQEIGGVDLEDPECRLSLQVALKARKLLS
ncbi:MAG TPA: helix-turn-helix domain-containing protein [Chloroflexota bacterium]|nr:helix-turn-helix domain-containing protein [Chloroflexota bacterium]